MPKTISLPSRANRALTQPTAGAEQGGGPAVELRLGLGVAASSEDNEFPESGPFLGGNPHKPLPFCDV